MKTLAALLIITSLTSCASSFVVVQDKAGILATPKQTVQVTNPELVREFEILKQSGIYHISNKPEAVTLTLAPLKTWHYGCGNPLLGSVLTMGILPATLPATITFGYTLTEGGSIKQYGHSIRAYTRHSIWEHLISSDGAHEIAEALKFSTRATIPTDGCLEATKSHLHE